MKFSLRFLLLIVAFFTVGGLGYYAYSLQARTLTYALEGMQLQKGMVMDVMVERPKFQSGDDDLFNRNALLSSLYLDGKPLSENTGSIDLTIDTYGFRVRLDALAVKQRLTLSASDYNSHPDVRYRLPTNISLEGGTPPTIQSTSYGLPKERRYSIDLLGFPDGVKPESLKLFYYRATSSTSPCSNKSPALAVPVEYETLAVYKGTLKDTLEIQAKYPLDAYFCLYAGISGEYTEIDRQDIEAFTLSGKALDILSPEYDMESRIEFRFSNPIYVDTGSTNSPEYIAHRTSQKVLFLKRLVVTPDIPLTLDNIVLTPNRAIVRLPLIAGVDYTFKLDGIEDIYGQQTSLSMPISPKRDPYLSLVLSGALSTLPARTPVWVKMFALDTKRTSHNVVLCRVGLETYSRLERIVDENKKEYSDQFYELLSGFSQKDCMKREILTAKNNHLSGIDISDFFPEKKQLPGLYVLAFADKDDAIYTSKWLKPVIFSLVDTHITMKLDAGGKALFFVTDFDKSTPVAGQEIRIYKNIGRTHTEKWNTTTQKLDISYLPLTTRTFATGITLGFTDKDGFLSLNMKDIFKDGDAYGYTFEEWWGGYEGNYRSFMVEARGSNRLGYVVSTWNDGIAGWNFGFGQEEYGWGQYSTSLAYLHTDRRLYLPGDTVYIHSIIRDFTDKLVLPSIDRTYALTIRDSSGKEVSRMSLKTNDFGSLSRSWKLPENSPLGYYSVDLMIVEGSTERYIDGGSTSFQVEIFKNPTFTSSISLSSADLDAGTIKNLRKKENVDRENYWYTDVYEGTFNLDAKVNASYYNGALVRNVPFTYRVYRSEYWGDETWNDCFWGCYYEPPIEFYTEGEGRIDTDGYGFIRVPVLFSSFYSDYRYTVEVTIQDPLTTETVTSASNLVVRMPDEYRMYDTTNPLTLKPEKKILTEGDTLSGVYEPTRGKWSKWYENRYEYTLSLRTYDMTEIEDIRGGTSEVMHPKDTVIATGSVIEENFRYNMKGKPSGEYHLIIIPKGITASGSTDTLGASDTVVYYLGADKNAKNPRIANNAISVISEKTVYKLGDTARILVRLPWEKSKVLLTIEKNGAIEKKYIDVPGNMFEYTIPVDERFIPNAYVGVVAFAPFNSKEALPEYRVGYTEIVTDMSEKKANLTVTADKKDYKTRENVNLSLSIQDRNGKPIVGEVAVMVVDESLIALLGNIDLDIIPKFYQKLPFSVRTSLSLIGMENRRYFSRRGIAGGSGGKGGGSLVSTRTVFENTAYYNGAVVTDSNGKASVRFTLPDNITSYRIIAIANTKASHFGVSESTINVRKDYVIEPHAPIIVRRGDTFTITANLFNSTSRITPVDILLDIDPKLFTGSLLETMKLQPNTPETATFTLKYTGPAAEQAVSYSLTMREGKNILDSLESSLQVVSDPLFEKRTVNFYEFTGSTLTMPIVYASTNTDMLRSRFTIDVSSTVLASSRDIFRTLLQYPYGCVEQTTSSTLPNAIALAIEAKLPIGIRPEEARKNILAGLEKLRTMQLPNGGFVYWPGETSENPTVTPYVVRSLITMRDLSGIVGQDMITNGINYLVNNEALYTDANSQAERFWTLAMAAHPEALKAKAKIDTSALTFHGWVAYLYGLHLTKALDSGMLKSFEERYFTTKPSAEENYWQYWNDAADRMIYARMLLERGEAPGLIYKRFLRDVLSNDWNSYYYSTQEKLQTFITLSRYLQIESSISSPIRTNLRTGILKTEGVLDTSNISFNRSFELEKVGPSIIADKTVARTLYVTTRTTEIPENPYIVKATQDAGVTISRSIRKVDERLGVDAEGKFIGLEPVPDNTFERGALYRITIKVSVPRYAKKSWTNFVVEDYLPGGWRPIQSSFNTNSALLGNNSEDSNWGWSHVETRTDRILAHAAYGYDKDMTYEYFIRPEQAGTYLLPPVTGYFLYKPDIRGYGTYERVVVK